MAGSPNLVLTPLLIGSVQPAAGSIGSIVQALNWPSVQPTNSFTPGTGAGAGLIDTVWSSAGRSLATGANENLDLNGALSDAFGASVALVRCKGLLLFAAAANTTKLTIGNGANPAQFGFGATTHTWDINPGGIFIATFPTTGWTITPATADGLKVTNAAGATALYDVIVLGGSA